MWINIVEETPDQLAEYARISIGFLVREVFDVAAIEALRRGENAIASPVPEPYWKDYDVHPNGHPTHWLARDKNRWAILAAYRDGQRVGGAAVVIARAEPDLTHDRLGGALLWDLRVAPDARRQGVGTSLLKRVTDVAVRVGAGRLQVETQQLNVPACRFYQRSGFALIDVRPHAYPELPDEVQLLWAKQLESASNPNRST